MSDIALDPKPERRGHTPDASGEQWWCKSHRRLATHLHRGEHVCDPRLGGILLPCRSERVDEPALLALINSTPALLDLLYDIDLMPEQVKLGTERERFMMLRIAQAFLEMKQ